MLGCARPRGEALAELARSTRQLLDALFSSVLVLSRVPQPFSWLFALALGMVGAGSCIDGLRAISLLTLARAAAAAFVFSCTWVRFALPFIYRTQLGEARGGAQPSVEPGADGAAKPASDPAVTALPHLPDDVALLILARLRLSELAAFGSCSRATRALSHAPSLWRRVVVPDQIESVSRAVRAIPQSLQRQPAAHACTIAIRGGTYVEGQRSRLHRLLGMDCGLRTGIRVSVPVVLQPLVAGEEVVIESDAGEALTLLPGAEGTLIRGITVRTLSFASHAIAVYADGVRIEGCALQASGRNSCGVVVTGRNVRATISRCAISSCGGGGVLLAYGVGPVCVSDSTISGNGWSGIGAFSGASVVVSRCSIRENAMYAVGVARDVSVTLREQPSNSMEANQLGGLHRYLAPPLHPQISMQSR